MDADKDKNPCGHLDGRLRVGYRSGETVGWAWTSAQGKGFKWPHLRAVAFSTGSLTKVMDTQIFSDDNAVTYPAVGVNPDGKLGVVYYRMGGPVQPEARSFIVDNPRDWVPSAGLNASTVVTSTNAPVKNEWGDYSTVTRYDGCEDVFLAGVHSLQGGSGDPSVEVKRAWFGLPGQGCPDYEVTDLAFITDNGRQGSAGDNLYIGSTTENTGFATPTSESRTAYYVSRDPKRSNDDIRLEPGHLVPPLAPGDEDIATAGQPVFKIPAVAVGGEFYVIACADDRTRIDDEISEDNNCLAEPPPDATTDPRLTIAGLIRDTGLSPDLTLRELVAQSPGSGTYTMPLPVRGQGVSAQSIQAVGIRADASPTKRFRRDGLPLEVVSSDARAPVRAVAAAGGLRQLRNVVLRVPRRVKAGRWYVRVCLRRAAKVRDGVWRNDCAVTPRRVPLRPRSR
jgi:hypothetical protein